MMTIGTGFGLMSISVIVADCVMLHCTKKKDLYQKIKEFDLKEKGANNDDGDDDDQDEEEGVRRNDKDNNSKHILSQRL